MRKNYINFLTVLLIFFGTLLPWSCAQKKQLKNYSDVKMLRENWKLQIADKIQNPDGALISTEGFNTDNWLNAVVPGTIMGSLVANNIIKNPYFGINLKKVNKKQFEKPWWYRTSFNLTKEDFDKTISLRFNGINYRANLWINGKKVADKDSFAGAFNMFTFKINDYITEGNNIIALELWQPVDGEYSIGFVDWNPQPPDRSMGIFRDVLLEMNAGVKIRSPFVQAKVDKESLQAAGLTIRSELENNSDKDISGYVKINYELGKLEKKISIPAGKTLSCIFTPKEFPQLNVQNVKLWWPNGMGSPNLYNIQIEFISDNKIIDKISGKYGIREINSYLDKDKNRVFKINGKFILIKGGGWVDDLLLQDTKESIENQIKYVKHMGLNSIRLEGFWGKDETLYDLCDQYGILIMLGWSCHWEWEEYLGKPTHSKYMAYNNPQDINLLTGYWENQLLWLRKHPSIYVWMTGSDKLPAPELEKQYVKLFNKYDNSRPYITSAGGVGSEQGVIGNDILVSEISGPTGMKMLGPYAYTPPVYWFTNTNLGGAYGFNTETCPGPNIPPLASLKKMLPEKYLWPIDKEYWEYHCGRNAFQSLDRYRVAINSRYGKSNSVAEFAFKSQLMNYELMRPMFEAFIANKPKSTGLIQWMLNSAWPEMYWQLYDSYLQPNGAFYAVKKSNNDLHLIYAYGKNKIYLSNNKLQNVEGLKAQIRAYDIHSKLVYDKEWTGSIKANSSKQIHELEQINKLSNVWFLDLRLINQYGKEIDNNFYWLSVKPDILDYSAADTMDWAYYTPSKSYADFTGLGQLAKAKLIYNYDYKQKNGYGIISLNVKNNSEKIAFFIYMDVLDADSKQPVLPIYWNDNYISLLPNEEQTYRAYFLLKNYNKKPTISIKGWNIETQLLE
jgi:exo-1,4-beta-D-glucosaminidase